MSATLRDTLAATPLPRLEAHMLWSHVLGRPRSWLIAHDTDPLDATQLAAFQALAARRLAGEPMAYLVGTREFYGRPFRVTPAVLIPRPETEVLVECALAALRGRPPGARVLDLGTGSGAVAITLALERPTARIQATDRSAAALDVARANARALGARLVFSLGDWYDTALVHRPFDLIVSNPPYVAADDAHLRQGDVRHEPPGALVGGADGLQAIRDIIQGSANHLAPDGQLCIEHGWDQASAVRALLVARGCVDVGSTTDLAGIERVTCGRLPRRSF